MFAYKAKEMFGAASNDDFTSLFIYQPNCIANKVSPCTGISADENGIIPSLLNFMYHQRFRLVNHVAFCIKILVIKGYKFKKDIIIKGKVHTSGILPVLVS